MESGTPIFLARRYWQLVDEGMSGKVNKLTQESQLKLQGNHQKVINDSNGGLVCIIFKKSI